jgi:hypothetical protein
MKLHVELFVLRCPLQCVGVRGRVVSPWGSWGRAAQALPGTAVGWVLQGAGPSTGAEVDTRHVASF